MFIGGFFFFKSSALKYPPLSYCSSPYGLITMSCLLISLYQGGTHSGCSRHCTRLVSCNAVAFLSPYLVVCLLRGAVDMSVSDDPEATSHLPPTYLPLQDGIMPIIQQRVNRGELKYIGSSAGRVSNKG